MLDDTVRATGLLTVNQPLRAGSDIRLIVHKSAVHGGAVCTLAASGFFPPPPPAR